MGECRAKEELSFSYNPPPPEISGPAVCTRIPHHLLLCTKWSLSFNFPQFTALLLLLGHSSQCTLLLVPPWVKERHNLVTGFWVFSIIFDLWGLVLWEVISHQGRVYDWADCKMRPGIQMLDSMIWRQKHVLNILPKICHWRIEWLIA